MALTKLLIVICKPSDMGGVDLDHRARVAIEQALNSKDIPSVLYQIKGDITPSQLLAEIDDYRPDIVHFIGHGDEDTEIVLVDEQGMAKSVPHEALKKLFQSKMVRMVLMNACYSVDQANVLRQVVKCAIGMNARISNTAASVFTAEFYRNISKGDSVQAAFDDAILALDLNDNPQKIVPAIVFGDGVDGTKLRLFSWSKLCLDSLQNVSITGSDREKLEFKKIISHNTFGFTATVDHTCTGQLRALESTDISNEKSTGKSVFKFGISGNWNCTLQYSAFTDIEIPGIFADVPDGTFDVPLGKPQKMTGRFTLGITIVNGVIEASPIVLSGVSQDDRRAKDVNQHINRAVREKLSSLSN